MTVTLWPSRFYPQVHQSNRFAFLPGAYLYDSKRFHGSNQGEGVNPMFYSPNIPHGHTSKSTHSASLMAGSTQFGKPQNKKGRSFLIGLREVQKGLRIPGAMPAAKHAEQPHR
jgi:hypothetical protein